MVGLMAHKVKITYLPLKHYGKSARYQKREPVFIGK